MQNREKRKAFNITVEYVLILLLATALVGACLSVFTDNLSVLFSQERNYKTILKHEKENLCIQNILSKQLTR